MNLCAPYLEYFLEQIFYLATPGISYSAEDRCEVSEMPSICPIRMHEDLISVFKVIHILLELLTESVMDIISPNVLYPRSSTHS